MTERNTNVFADEAGDARQSMDPRTIVSRFRPQYRPLSAEEKQLHDDIKAKAVEMELLFVQVKQGRYTPLALTSLEQSVMWIIKELTA